MEQGQSVRLRTVTGDLEARGTVRGVYLDGSRIVVEEPSGATWILGRDGGETWIRLGSKTGARVYVEIEKRSED